MAGRARASSRAYIARMYDQTRDVRRQPPVQRGRRRRPRLTGTAHPARGCTAASAAIGTSSTSRTSPRRRGFARRLAGDLDEIRADPVERGVDRAGRPARCAPPTGRARCRAARCAARAATVHARVRRADRAAGPARATRAPRSARRALSRPAASCSSNQSGADPRQRRRDAPPPSSRSRTVPPTAPRSRSRTPMPAELDPGPLADLAGPLGDLERVRLRLEIGEQVVPAHAAEPTPCSPRPAPRAPRICAWTSVSSAPPSSATAATSCTTAVRGRGRPAARHRPGARVARRAGAAAARWCSRPTSTTTTSPAARARPPHRRPLRGQRRRRGGASTASAVADGDELTAGSMRVAGARHARAHRHPPGLRDQDAATPTAPPAVFTGGSLLYGSVGRTDLVDPARTDEFTRAQFRSARRLADLLPDETRRLPHARVRQFLLGRRGDRRGPARSVTSAGATTRSPPTTRTPSSPRWSPT